MDPRQIAVGKKNVVGGECADGSAGSREAKIITSQGQADW